MAAEAERAQGEHGFLLHLGGCVHLLGGLRHALPNGLDPGLGLSERLLVLAAQHLE